MTGRRLCVADLSDERDTLIEHEDKGRATYEVELVRGFTLRANKSETHWWLNFKLEAQENQPMGHPLTGAAFGGCGVWRDATDRAPCPWCHRPFGADGRADGWAEAAEFHGEIQAAYS